MIRLYTWAFCVISDAKFCSIWHLYIIPAIGTLKCKIKQCFFEKETYPMMRFRTLVVLSVLLTLPAAAVYSSTGVG
ncbi:MAG TPA: hypothetical protein VJZ27_04650, partial [Aggregatilineales bacterium]|nr:hypothetical protein [Aggregatilineales bacterium]